MKKILALILSPLCALAHASPWDLEINQYDQFGIGRIPRLMPLPSGGQSGMLMYDVVSNWPKIGTIDSTLAWSGTVLGVNPLTLAGKFNTPTGTTAQYIRGDGSLATFPAIPTRSFANPARSLNTAFQISTTRDAWVGYSVNISVTSALLAGQEGRVHLEYADDSGFTTNVVTVASAVNATSGVLNLTNVGPGSVTGWIPAAKYARIRTENITGTPTYSLTRTQEVQQ